MSDFLKVEKVGTNPDDQQYLSWDQYQALDVDGTTVTLPTNPMNFTLSDIINWIAQSQSRIESETARKEKLINIKNRAEELG